MEFLKGLLSVCPSRRWSAEDALRHPFVTKDKFVKGAFVSLMEEKRKNNFLTLSGFQMGQDMKTQLSFVPPNGLGFSMNSDALGKSVRYPIPSFQFPNGPINFDPRYNQGIHPNNNINNTFVRPNFIPPNFNQSNLTDCGSGPHKVPMFNSKLTSQQHLPFCQENSFRTANYQLYDGKHSSQKRDYRARSNSDFADDKLKFFKTEQKRSKEIKEMSMASEVEEFILDFKD